MKLRSVLLSFLSGTGERALDIVYPGFCRECGEPTAGRDPFCLPCASSIRWIGSACPRCGMPAVRPGPDSCGECSGRPLHFDRAAAAAEYTGPWRTAVLRFKYLSDHGLRHPLVDGLVRIARLAFDPDPPGAIVPVPPHPLRKLLRGRDHIDELAVDLAARLGIPLRRALRRTRWISSQTSLPRVKRLANPRGAYGLRWAYGPRRARRRLPASIFLLDDVLTTGATASECARALREAGAKRIAVIALARSPC
jgi:predicted amidophosphoribosyltransferase